MENGVDGETGTRNPSIRNRNDKYIMKENRVVSYIKKNVDGTRKRSLS